MGHRFFAPQEILRKKLTVVLVDIPSVALHEFLFFCPIETRQSVPGDMRVHMVHRMEVIVQKQKCEEPTIFNNSGAGLHVLMGAMLGKCTDLEKREPAVGCDKIGPQRIARSHDDPNHQRGGQKMPEPILEHIPTPSAYLPNIT